MVSVYFPSSAVNASNKEQLWDLFQDFMRKMDTTRQASLPLPARAKSGFTIPSKWSATVSISFEPAAQRRSDFRPWQASSSTCTFADDFKQHSTATQDTAVSTSLPVVSVVTQSSSDASVYVVTATSMVSNMSTSSPRVQHVKLFPQGSFNASFCKNNHQGRRYHRRGRHNATTLGQRSCTFGQGPGSREG